MKHSSLNIIVLVALILLTLCKCEDTQETSDPVILDHIQKLKGKWKVSSVTQDEVMQDGWSDFVLTISPIEGSGKLAYLITNNPYKTPWASIVTGHFIFDANEPHKYLIREDDVVMEYEVAEQTLALRFTYQELNAGGRLSGTEGNWVFSFEKP